MIDYASGRNRYIGYLISLATHSYKDMKVALDCANGSAWMIAKNVFEALGAETYVLSNTPNGLNINDVCVKTIFTAHIAKGRGRFDQSGKIIHRDVLSFLILFPPYRNAVF